MGNRFYCKASDRVSRKKKTKKKNYDKERKTPAVQSGTRTRQTQNTENLENKKYEELLKEDEEEKRTKRIPALGRERCHLSVNPSLERVTA